MAVKSLGLEQGRRCESAGYSAVLCHSAGNERVRAGFSLVPVPQPSVPEPGSSSVSLSLPAHCAHVGLRARHTHTHTTQTHTLCTRVGTPSSFGSPCGTFSVFLQPSPELFNTDGLCCFSHGRGGSRTRSFNVISNSSGQCWRGCVMCVKGWKSFCAPR